MAIKNFINFATNRIHPAVFDDYMNSEAYLPQDMVGADDSTLDFSKLGWMMSVRDDMKKNDTWTADVDSLIGDMSTLTHSSVSEGALNWKTLSAGNYNILQQLVYDNRANGSFDMNIEYLPDYLGIISELLHSKFDENQMSAAEMIVEFGLNNAASKIDPSKLGSNSTDNIASRTLSLYFSCYRKYAMERISGVENGKASKTLNVIRAAIGAGNIGEKYSEFLYENSPSQAASGSPKNELSRYISSSSVRMLEETMSLIMVDIGAPEGETNDSVLSILSSCSNASIGLSATSSQFDTDRYVSDTSSFVFNKGYSPLYFYISKYRSECTKELLDILSTVYSVFAVSLSTEYVEGFTPLGLLSHYLEIIDDSWGNAEVAEFIKEKTMAASSSVAGNTPYPLITALNSVRDFTGGKSSNAFGLVNNIFLKINNEHREWWATKTSNDNNSSTPADFESIFTSLASEVLPPLIATYSVYQVWMFEYGKEVGS